MKCFATRSRLCNDSLGQRIALAEGRFSHVRRVHEHNAATVVNATGNDRSGVDGGVN